VADGIAPSRTGYDEGPPRLESGLNGHGLRLR
jgi:hypothetical protein